MADQRRRCDLDTFRGVTITAPLITADAKLAELVREAAEDFNSTVDITHVAGLAVRFTTHMWTQLPTRSHVGLIEIERPADCDANPRR